MSLVHGAGSGKQATFTGSDPSGGQLLVVTPGLVVGYDPSSGTMYAYTPADG